MNKSKNIKRMINIGLIGTLSIVFLTGCTTKSEKLNITEEPKKMDLGLNIEERGEGNFYLVDSVTTTECDKILYKFLDNNDTVLAQLGYNAWGMNGKKVSYIYLDGKLIEKTVLSDVQSSLTLEKEDLEYGVHIVEVLQFKNGENLESDNIEFYEKAEYVITNNVEEYENGIKEVECTGDESDVINNENILSSTLEPVDNMKEAEHLDNIDEYIDTTVEHIGYIDEYTYNKESSLDTEMILSDIIVPESIGIIAPEVENNIQQTEYANDELYTNVQK